MDEPLRIAVVGAGNIAQQHLPVLNALPETEVVALCDAKPEVLAQTARRFNVERTFDAIDDLIAWGAYDAVYLMVSPSRNAEVGERFIRLGAPVFLEKPPGLYVEQAEALARAVDETGTITQVAFNRRFYTSIRAGHAALLDTGPILTVSIEAHEDLTSLWTNPRRDDEERRRRVFSNTHPLDLLRYFGGDVRDVKGWFTHFANPMPDSYTGYLQFESGAIGRAAVDHFGTRGEGHRFQVRTAAATLQSYDGFNRVVLDRRDHEPVEFGLTGDDLKFKPGFAGETRAFVTAVRENRQPQFPAATIWDGLATLRTIEAITRSAEWPGG